MMPTQDDGCFDSEFCFPHDYGEFDGETHDLEPTPLHPFLEPLPLHPCYNPQHCDLHQLFVDPFQPGQQLEQQPNELCPFPTCSLSSNMCTVPYDCRTTSEAGSPNASSTSVVTNPTLLNDHDQDVLGISMPSSLLVSSTSSSSLSQNYSFSSVRPNDVLLGRGKVLADYPGHVKYRRLVDAYMSQYLESNKIEKTCIAEVIVQVVQESSGRFLIPQKGVTTASSSPTVEIYSHGMLWEEVDHATARNKVAHDFRNRRHLLNSTRRSP
jgi:hypothetical protein